MGRPRRLYAEGIYHVTAHASDDRQLFSDDADRLAFLEHLTLAFVPLGLSIVSYVLMSTHYHSVVATPDDRIARGLQTLHGGYSARFNRRHRRHAHLFRAHCFARRITDNDDLVTVTRYLALNPVAAGIVIRPLDWPWSSSRAHAGLERPAIPLAEAPLRSAYDDSPDWRERYRRVIEDPLVSASAGTRDRRSRSMGRASGT
jgi:REP element-mobilizing transposase RayT